MRGSRLSATQAHLWRLLCRDHPFDLSARLCLEIEGRLDVAALERAVATVLDRHDILRTRYRRAAPDALPESAIRPAGECRLGRESLAGLDAAAQQAAIDHRLERADAAARFAPAAPLLLALSESRQVLLLRLPALSADATALDNLAREIVLAYGGAIGAGTPELDEPLQYGDVARWMNDCLADDSSFAARDRRRHLSPAGWAPTRLSPLPAPFAAPAAAAPSPQADPESGRRPAPRLAPRVPLGLELTLPSQAAARLEAVAGELDIAWQTIVLAGWAVLLGRLARTPELVLGVVSPGRSYEELDDAIGLLARTLPLDLTLDDAEPFADLAHRLDGAAGEIRDSDGFHPWSELATSGADGRIEPFFPVLFEPSEVPSLPDLPDVRFTVRSRRARTDRFELAVVAESRRGRPAVGLEYDPRRFARSEAGRLAERLGAVLADACRSPRAPLGDLDGLGESERRLLLVDFNATEAGYDSARTIHQPIAQRIAERPAATAVVCGEDRLDYAELGDRAGRIAHYLVRQGVGPGVRVGICIERSVELICGIAGTLAAGGAYVPLDPAYPADRLAYMLADSGAPVLLTQRHLLSKLDAEGVRVACLDTDGGKLGGRGDAQPDGGGEDAPSGEVAAPPAESAARPDDLAYVIYTSGSSGRPKGVMVEHRHVVHSTLARVHYYQEPIERFLLLASCSFDSSVAGIFWALTEGAMLVLPREGQQQDPQAIADLISQHRITHMLSLPALYETILDRGEAGTALDSLRTVVLHGEVFAGELTRRHYRHLPACRLYNEYGPTEDSVWSTVYEIPPSVDSGQIPIGRPIANTTAYVTDGALGLLPLGVPGELVVGGTGVARGYLGQPQLTAGRFVPDPFSSRPGARLYRTGDLARFREDGNLDFLGRVDDQVKIRGYRIEPVEVEIALTEHAGVRQAVVMARPRPSGALQLVAYVVREEGSTVREAELRRDLAARLPEFMVPGAFVFLDALPLMPNGKIDKHSLPEPSEVRPDLEQAFVAPEGEIEEFVAGRWSDILGIRRIGARDNFFELGGDSIQAAIITNRLRDRFGDHVTVGTFFRQPTVRQLAGAIAAARSGADSATPSEVSSEASSETAS